MRTFSPRPLKLYITDNLPSATSTSRLFGPMSLKSKASNPRDNAGKAWSQKKLRLKYLLSPKKQALTTESRPRGDSNSPQAKEILLSPRSMSIERGYRQFAVNKPTRPYSQQAMARARILKLPNHMPQHANSQNSLSPTPISSRSPTFSHKVASLVEKIMVSRNKRLKIQKQMQDNVTQKHEQFSQIVKDVKDTFELQTVAETRRVKGKYNLLDKYLNSVELLQYLRSL